MAGFLSVVSSTLVGFVLVVFPWTEAWDSNYVLHLHPVVRTLLLHTVTRGAVSGLGFVNLLLAIHETRRHVLGEEERGRR